MLTCSIDIALSECCRKFVLLASGTEPVGVVNSTSEPVGVVTTEPAPNDATNSSATGVNDTASGTEPVGVSSMTLVHVPHRECTSRGKRAAPPSFNLTSNEHVICKKKSWKTRKTNDSVSIGRKAKKNQKKQVSVTKDVKSKPMSKKITRKTIPQKKTKKFHKKKCRGCGVIEGSKQDIQMEQDWIACDGCNKWFHDECAESNGAMDDDYFTCKACIA